MKKSTGIVALLLVVSLAACAAPSSFLIRNDTANDVIVRFVPTVTGGSFGYEVPARSSGWAWSDEAGSLNGTVSLFDVNCELAGTWRVPEGGGALTIATTGAALGPITTEAGPPRHFLGYVSRCSEQHVH